MISRDFQNCFCYSAIKNRKESGYLSLMKTHKDIQNHTKNKHFFIYLLLKGHRRTQHH